MQTDNGKKKKKSSWILGNKCYFYKKYKNANYKISPIE